MSAHCFSLPKQFVLSSGEVLHDAEIAYGTRGVLTADRTNAVLYIHPLSGSASLEHTTIDTEKYFVISPNVLGSCYGSTGPESIDPNTDDPYHGLFPAISIRDIAKSLLLLLDHMQIETLSFGIAGSFGAMVLLELALLAPKRFRRLIILSCGAEHSAWRIAFSSVIRKVIEHGLISQENTDHAFSLARQLAMISYRSGEEFNERFARARRSDDLFEVESYLEYQGEKIVGRFSPYSYMTLTHAMEGYSLFEGRPCSRADILSELALPILIVGATSDLLYPEDELRAFARELPNAQYASLHAPYGHDSFLVAADAVTSITNQFLEATAYEHEHAYA